MSIWIRSQDGKTLIRSMYLCVSKTNEFLGKEEQEPCVRADGAYVGTYTEAEAQAVIDQIQGYINRCAKTVFQMPEAGFSKKEGAFSTPCGECFCGLIDAENPVRPVPFGCGYLDDCKAAWNRGCR